MSDYIVSVVENISIMVNAKRKGTTFERIVKKLIQKQEPGTEVFRSPASLGSADLIGISKLELTIPPIITSIVSLYQCKYLKKYMSKKETIKLLADAERLGAGALLVYREKPRGKIIFEDLNH